MGRAVGLIAGREFRTYVATLSFWIALAIGPLLMAGALAAGIGSAMPIAVAVQANPQTGSGDPQLVRSALAALADAGKLEHRHFRPVANAHLGLVLEQRPDNRLVLRFSPDFPLSPTGRELVARTIERDWARERLYADHARPLVVTENAADARSSGDDAGALSRFVLVMILWLTLTGSLGMLLQAVVRERANSSLEALLAAARPFEIMAGKLLGVGAVSLLVLVAWLGCAAALSALVPTAPGLVSHVFAGIAAPAALLRAAFVYCLAYAFYGSITVGLGASARDVAAAQNLSRPMFAVLLAVFFVALAGASGAGLALSWLVYVPPFTPFILLLYDPAYLPAISQLLALALLLLAIAGAAWLAAGRLTLSAGAAAKTQS